MFMFCSACGKYRESEENRFCTVCGHEHGTPVVLPDHLTRISSVHVHEGGPVRVINGPKTTTVTTDNKSTKVVAVLVVIGIISVALFGLISWPTEEGPPDIYAQPIDEDRYLGLYYDFHPDADRFTIFFNEDGGLVFKLNGELSANYDLYTWTFRDLNHPSSSNVKYYSEYGGEVIQKNDPWLTFLVPKFGEYVITVTCYKTINGKETFQAQYKGGVNYHGTISRDYNWTYEGQKYSVSTSFELSEYMDYKASQKGRRWINDYNRVTSFVTIDDPVMMDLANSLKAAYKGDSNVKDGYYANFILGFVQICFDYPPYSGGSKFSTELDMSADKYLYGADEYFAYPLETLYHGMGDCEDTSILAATLFYLCGFDAAVCVLPGHAVAGVVIEGYDTGYYQSSIFEVLTQTVDGKTYYGCETTANSAMKAGLVDKSGYDDKPYSEYVGTRSILRQWYGFYPVTSS